MGITKRKRTASIRTIFSVGVGIIGLWLSIRGIPLDHLSRIIKGADIWFVFVSLGIVFINVFLVAIRWWVIIIISWTWSGFRTILGGVFVGQMLNIAIPLRVGELARIYFVGERMNLSKSRLIGTLVVEKTADTVAMAIAIIWLMLGITLPTWAVSPSVAIIWMSLAALIFILLISFWGRYIIDKLSPLLNKLPSPWNDRAIKVSKLGLSGFGSMRDAPRQAAIWGITISSLFLSGLTNYFVILALNIQVPFAAAFFVLLVLQIGTAPPSAPAKLGVFHYLTILSLAVFSVGQDQALAYALILYVVALLSKVVIGGLVLFRTRWRWSPNQMNLTVR